MATMMMMAMDTDPIPIPPAPAASSSAVVPLPAPGSKGGSSSIPLALHQWSKLLARAESTRLDPDRFASYASMLHSKHRLPPAMIADLVLRPTRSNRDSLDPRTPQYLGHLLRLGMVDAAGVLRALLRYSTLHGELDRSGGGEDDDEMGDMGRGGEGQKKKKGDKKGLVRWRSSYASEEVIFWRLAKAVSNLPGAQAVGGGVGGGGGGGGKKSDDKLLVGIKNAMDAIAVVRMMTQWMRLFTDAATAFSRDTFGAIHSLQAKEEVESSRAAFLLLLLEVCKHPTVLATLGKEGLRDVRKELANILEAFIPTMMQTSHEIASRLELFRTGTLASFDPEDKKESAVPDMNSYMDNLIGLERFQVPEIPVVNSRAGLYIYLNAALVGRPSIDDNALYTYFHNRYQGDIQTQAIQFILASFDVLANAVVHNEGSNTGHLLKSYVVNKVPLILSSFATSTTSMYPFDAEFCITQALGQVDTTVFPTLSGMFDMPTNSSFLDSVRQDFCFACQLHGLLSQTAIENLLGDITYQSLPDEGRYVKETLVQSCLEDPERTLKLIGELDNMNGNVGAAAQAIIEVIGTLCRSDGTMPLKQLCSQLASKPLALDILLLFDKPYKILDPLRQLLDNWSANKGGYDEDMGEAQPVYEEFGPILLLLLAFVYRYNLSTADLGIRSSESFVGKLLSRGHLSRPLGELSDQEKSHMNGWIHGLFDTEAGGLGDDLMSSCPPENFYLLMPTLFHQIVLALSTGRLTDDMLKTGLEYLVDILLLPSLVPALLYLSNQLWANQPQTQRAIIRILQLILRPSSISHEATTMLSSVLNIIAKPLEHSLRSYQRQDPKSQEVEPLLRALKENLPLSRRTGGADHNELETWTGTHHVTTTGGGGGGGPSGHHNTSGGGSGPVGSPHQHHGGGLAGSVRTTVANLTQWAQHPSIGLPAPYTHRQILVAIKMLGAKQLLSVLVEELKDQSENLGNDTSVAYDVLTSIICAPNCTTSPASSLTTASAASEDTAAQQQHQAQHQQHQRRLTLREALKSEAEDWKKLQKAGPDGHVAAETIVRLYRRVEAQMTPLPPPVVVPVVDEAGVMLGSAEMDNALGVVTGDTSLDDALAAAVEATAAAAAAAGGSLHDAMSLDTTGLGGTGGSVGGGAGDLSALASAAGSVVGGNSGLDGMSTDDIFGLSAGSADFSRDMDSFNWDTMDLGP